MRYILCIILLAFSRPVCAQQAHNIRLLCNWNDTSRAPVNGSGQHWNDVWGFTAGGREYAVIGGTNGTHIIDVGTCREAAYYPGRSGNVVHRDYKTYRNYLYAVSDEGYASLQVFDLNYLPDSLHLVSERSDHLTRAHTIFIDTARARLYAAGATDFWGVQSNIQIYSLAQPDNPVYLASVNQVIYTHALYARNDTLWCSNAFEGYRVLEVSDPQSPRIVGGLVNYPYKGYNHSSWVGEDGIGLMTDETYGKQVKVIDARDPEDIRVLATFSPRGDDTTSISHNPYLLGRSAVVSYYMDGLQIYDLSDPYKPVRTGYYQTYTGPPAQTYAGAWGAYPYLPSRKILVSDMQRGLFVLDAGAALAVAAEPHSQIAVYPNPVSAGQPVRVSIPGNVTGSLRLQIRDIAGRTLLDLHTIYNGNGPLEVSLPDDWPGGVYLLRVSSPAGRFTGRILKR